MSTPSQRPGSIGSGGPVSMRPSVRAFVALDFDAASVRRLESVAAILRAGDLAPEMARLRWEPRTNLHLTLKFLGTVSAEVTADIASRIPTWAQAAGPFRMKLRAPTAFPSSRKADAIVSIVADDAEYLADLASLIADHAETLGIAKETRTFRPHVTLARTKATLDAKSWLEAMARDPGTLGEIACPTLALYRSDPLPHGSMYTAIARAPLRT